MPMPSLWVRLMMMLKPTLDNIRKRTRIQDLELRLADANRHASDVEHRITRICGGFHILGDRNASGVGTGDHSCCRG